MNSLLAILSPDVSHLGFDTRGIMRRGVVAEKDSDLVKHRDVWGLHLRQIFLVGLCLQILESRDFVAEALIG